MKIEFADLGDWGDAQLFSEYDPQGPVIRINSRVADALPPEERDAFVKHAIAHEMYHHAEHTGEIPVIADRTEREKAASVAVRLAALAHGPSIPQDDKCP